jgi:hypothetical protein
MKSFVLSMLLAVSLATVAAIAITRAALPESTWEQPPSAPAGRSAATAQRSPAQVVQSLEPAQTTASQFSQVDAVEVVAARFGTSARADTMRITLRTSARIEHHSPGHWTVRFNEASWTAHGAGTRYAEPDNEAARQLEDEASKP